MLTYGTLDFTDWYSVEILPWVEIAGSVSSGICTMRPYIISPAQCKIAVSPLLTHWRYCSLALTHRHYLCHNISTLFIYPHSSKLHHWHWSRHMSVLVNSEVTVKGIDKISCYFTTTIRFKDSNTFIHQNCMISTWNDTLTLVLNNCRILSMSPSYNRWYGDPY